VRQAVGFSSASSIYSIQLDPIALDAALQKAERSTQFRGQKPMNIKWWDRNISWPKYLVALVILGIVTSFLIFLAERYFGANLSEYAIGAISAAIGVPIASWFARK
jgi:hypothetical protein